MNEYEVRVTRQALEQMKDVTEKSISEIEKIVKKEPAMA